MSNSPSVARRRLSPITLLGVMVVPKILVARAATCWRCSALVPGPANVALVPMH